jgi:2-polyprenyl-3-methyl-5-hydroxy-6-metoxy-1,4-benzoquinol methylase
MKNLKNCPACESNSFSSFLQAKDRYNPSKKYSYVKCRNCDIVLLNEREDNKEFIAYNLDEKPSIAQKLVMWLFYSRLKRVKSGGKILDFGAGSGNLSQYLKNKGYDVDSYEVDEKSKNWLKEKRKLNVIDKPKDNYYDAIILEQVLEHVPRPVETLEKLKDSLKKDGVLFISLPNINSTQAKLFKEEWFHLDAPRHINHFYGRSFSRLINKLNLKIKKSHYFNFHIDLTGWYWSMKKKKSGDLRNLLDLAILSIFFPLMLIDTFNKSTAYVLYILAK